MSAPLRVMFDLVRDNLNHRASRETRIDPDLS